VAVKRCPKHPDGCKEFQARTGERAHPNLTPPKSYPGHPADRLRIGDGLNRLASINFLQQIYRTGGRTSGRAHRTRYPRPEGI